MYAWRSEDEYQGTTFLCNREPGELFLCGGNLPKAKPPVLPGPYVAKVDATTGKQIWRTYVENANVSGNWIGVNNLNILANGTIVTSWSNQIALLDPDTGRIVRTGSLPSGEAPPGDSHFKHLTVAPDGTLILKNQTRAKVITDQGTLAMVKGVRKGMRLPPSIFVAVDGQTLEVLDTVQLPELAATPHGITTCEGKIAIYTCADEHAYRCFWDPDSRKLAPPKTCIDLEKDMLYSADAGVGKVAGIRLDQATGEMTTEFVVETTTLTFQPLIGPKDQRVLVLTNMKGDIPLMNVLMDIVSGKYKVQVTWRDAATGRILAESDFFEPLTFNSLIVPGYGGRVYYPTDQGFTTLQVRPKARSSS